jgi:hypothetical protein
MCSYDFTEHIIFEKEMITPASFTATLFFHPAHSASIVLHLFGVIPQEEAHINSAVQNMSFIVQSSVLNQWLINLFQSQIFQCPQKKE